MDVAEYCREIETYLCRRNDGHLIRIVGPAFELVCGWAERGVPLKVAFRGIAWYCERYYAKGPRRRPVRIEFCEADVLDAFDQWRRAVGVTAPGSGADEGAAPAPRKPALAAHVERAIARLTTRRGGGKRSAEFDARIAAAVRDLDGLAAAAKQARGEARAAIVSRLAGIDRDLMDAALADLDDGTASRLRQEAVDELAPFGGRMSGEAREQAVALAFRRLVREAMGLPVLTYD